MFKTIRSTIVFVVIASLVGFVMGLLGVDGFTRAAVAIAFASAGSMAIGAIGATRAQVAVEGQAKSDLLAKAAEADRGAILFYRVGFNGKLAGVDIAIDGIVVAQLKTPAGTRVTVMPGSRQLSALTSANMGGKPGLLAIDVRPGKTLAIQVKMGMGKLLLVPNHDIADARRRMAVMPIVKPERDSL